MSAVIQRLHPQTRIARWQWTAGVVAAASGILIATVARLPVPYMDDWDWLRWVLADRSPSAYFIPHNEHLIPIPRLLLALQYRLEGSNGWTMLVAAVTCLVTVAALVLREIRRRFPDDPLLRRWAGGLSLSLMFLAWQTQSLVFPSAIGLPLVQLFAVVALVCVLNATDDGRPGAVYWLGASVLSSAGAVLSSSHGVAVPFVLSVVALCRRAHLRTAIGLCALGTVAMLGYLGATGVSRISGGPLSSLLSSPGAVAAYFCAFHASFLTQVDVRLGTITGAILVAIAVAVTTATGLGGQRRPRLEHFAVGLLVLTMTSAALAAPARVEFGTAQAAQSRYATLVLPFWTALTLTGISRLGRQGFHWLAGPAVAVSLALLAAQAVMGAVWIAKAGHVATAGLAVTTGVRDDAWVRSLHPNPEVVYEVADRLRRDGDNLFAEVGSDARLVEPTPVDACETEAPFVAAPVGGGLRVTGSVQTRAESAWIRDATGRIVGLARRVPVVSEANARPMDIARAVLRSVASWPQTNNAWIGFAATGSGAPYTMVFLDRTAMPLCQAVLPRSIDR